MKSDYLVVGAGAMGMAFTDVLLAETDATVTLVDRRAQPGGHWNDAYPYVRLHQPSMFYGVPSTPLGEDHRDTSGGNEGLFELAPKGELLTYYERLLQRRFLASGRVSYRSRHEYLGEGRIRSLVTGGETEVEAAHLVDATYMNVTVPSMRPPAYAVDPAATVIAPNQLPLLDAPAERYVVIGAGKTGIDACLWLLEQQVPSECIVWIMPRDSWMLDREQIQPTARFFDETIGGFAIESEAIAQAESIPDLFRRLEQAGRLLRIDPNVEPTMYRCATVTRRELEELRRLENIVRLGRVQRVAASEIELDGGTLPTSSATVHVDCTADGLERRPARPIFDGGRITLQSVRTCQQVFSAAFIAHVEATYEDDASKNELCQAIPHPDTALDWLRCGLQNRLNAARWSADDELAQWIATCRLDVTASAMIGTEAERIASVFARLAAATPPAMKRLEELLSQEADRAS